MKLSWVNPIAVFAAVLDRKFQGVVPLLAIVITIEFFSLGCSLVCDCLHGLFGFLLLPSPCRERLVSLLILGYSINCISSEGWS
jgi:hypothetical protein